MTTKLLAIGLIISVGWEIRADDPTTIHANPSPQSALERVDLDRKFGVGVVLGEPTGASLKYFLTDTTAIDGAVGWGFHDETDLYLHSDFLWHLNDVCEVLDGSLSLYFGIGGRLKFRDHQDDRVGVRVPIGVSYMFDSVPVDIFAEVAPLIDFAPSASGGFTAGMGVRFWF